MNQHEFGTENVLNKNNDRNEYYGVKVTFYIIQNYTFKV